jgi:site-specific recombinase XerD
VGFDPTAFAMIEQWLERRKALGINGRASIFCTLDGKLMKAAYVRALLPRLANKASIEKRVHAHGLRHTHAAELAREGVPMNVIQAQLGHSNLGTTSCYLAHIAPAEVISVMQGRAWDV